MTTFDQFSNWGDQERAGAEGKKTVNLKLNALSAAQVLAIDRALFDIGDYGEIHLIVKHGQLRFIGKLKTEAVLP
jgi:hypothetical protein